MSKLAKMVTAAAVGVICCTVSPAGSAAQEEPASVQYAPTMLVLDASGSMKAQDPAGGTKIAAAKRALHSVVDVLPRDARLGLLAYGTSTGSSDAERAEGCRDVSVVQQLGPTDKRAMNTSIDGITPRGYTPIGKALRVAAGHLPQEGPRSIVLVSDGKDTCAPPGPCDVARELDGRGVDLVVHTVGFGVEQGARAQLSCVAQTTGGTYTEAPDAGSLEQALPRVTATAMRNYEPAGTPIRGASEYDTAPVAAPGQHLDTIGQNKKRYYAVDIPDGATAYFSATTSFPRARGVDAADDFNSLNLEVYGADGQDCNEYESSQITNSSDGKALTVAHIWRGATEEKTGDTDDDRCRGGGRYYFAVTWDRISAGAPARLPVELLVGVEPSVLDAGPAPASAEVTFTEPTAEPVAVTGGGSFNVAGTLPGSGSYSDVLRRGEFVFYRVRLAWGQGLAYRVQFGESPGRGLDNLSRNETTLYSPFRKELEWESFSYDGDADTLPSGGGSLATVPIRYSNRTVDAADVRGESVAGWYYIAVALSPTREEPAAAAPVPVRIDLTVTGTEEPGPRYAYASPQRRDAGTFGENGPPRALPADNGESMSGRQRTAVVTEQAADGAISTVGWVVIAGGGVLLVAVPAVMLLIRRRRFRP